MFRSNFSTSFVAMLSLLSTSASLRQRPFVAAFYCVDSTAMNSRAFSSLKRGVFTNNSANACKRELQRTPLPTVGMSSTSQASASAVSTMLPRVKAVNAKESTDGNPVLVKGWVRTIRKQKTLAFVEVNDGSNMNGIQCVLSFDAIDQDTQKGRNMLIVRLSLI